MNDNDDRPLLKITGLWKTRSSKDGKEFLTGKLTFGTQLFIFENKFKSKPSDPDYHMFIGARRKTKSEDNVSWDSSSEPPPIGDEDYCPPSAYEDLPF